MGWLCFTIKDKAGRSYDRCILPKMKPAATVVPKLRRGDKIRVIGTLSDLEVFGADKHDLWFYVQRIQMIKPALSD